MNRKIPMVIGEKREGDIGISYSNNELAMNELNWNAELDLNKMCLDSLNFKYTNI